LNPRTRRHAYIGLAIAGGGLAVALAVGWVLAGSSSGEFQAVKKVQKGQAVAVYVAGTGGANAPSNDSVTCARTVTSNITTANLTADTLSYGAVAAAVSWTSATGSGVDTQVTITDPGSPALVASSTIAPGTKQTYDGFTVRFSIPCAARTGHLAIGVTTQYGFGSGEIGFVGTGSGTAIPIGWAVPLGVTVATGLVLMAIRRRHRRQGSR
jgi:hypothetical protein